MQTKQSRDVMGENVIEYKKSHGRPCKSRHWEVDDEGRCDEETDHGKEGRRKPLIAGMKRRR
jgi:hypothetical protein